MLELRLLQGSLLKKKLIDAIKDLVNDADANFEFSATGFSLQAMNSSRVVLVALFLGSEGFEHYRCDHDISMGMNLDNMARVLKCAENDEIVTIKADDGSDTVSFMFENPSQNEIENYPMKLIDIDIERLAIPEVEYHAIVSMPSAEFSRICREHSSFGDTVMISVTKEGVKFSTRGNICNPEDAKIIEMKEPIVSLSFDLRYLNSFTKASPLSDTVTLSLSSELPVAVEYKIAQMGYVRYYLAPKIEEEEEEEEDA